MSFESPANSRLGRSLIGLLAVVGLVLQLVSPTMAHARSGADVGADWIEICAEAGPVFVRLLDDGTVEERTPQSPAHGGCPKCLTCVTCAGVAGIDPGVSTIDGSVAFAALLAIDEADVAVFVSKAWERPMTRGPPLAPQRKNEMARVGHVMTANPTEGGAL
ncbi:DUF2946 family protein [Shimia sagamensis]|nr:DUF2946 family protein [Shimia sagamensis]